MLAFWGGSAAKRRHFPCGGARGVSEQVALVRTLAIFLPTFNPSESYSQNTAVDPPKTGCHFTVACAKMRHLYRQEPKSRRVPSVEPSSDPVIRKGSGPKRDMAFRESLRTLAGYWAALRKHRVVASLAAAATLVATILVAALTPSYFESTSTLLLSMWVYVQVGVAFTLLVALATAVGFEGVTWPLRAAEQI